MLKTFKCCSIHCPQYKVQTHQDLKPFTNLILLTSSASSVATCCFSLWMFFEQVHNTPTFSSFKSQCVGHLAFPGTFLSLCTPLCDYITIELSPPIVVITWYSSYFSHCTRIYEVWDWLALSFSPLYFQNLIQCLPHSRQSE